MSIPKTAMVLAAGGAVNVFRPRSTQEGQGRAWYPVWNSGSGYALGLQAGAELTLMENRFVPARFKDGYGPVGAWFLFFKAKATNSLGEDYCAKADAVAKAEALMAEIKSTVNDLEPDQQQALVALMWLGRGDYDVEEWTQALEAAHDAWNMRTAEYLIATPLVADYLEEGLSQLGYSCED